MRSPNTQQTLAIEGSANLSKRRQKDLASAAHYVVFYHHMPERMNLTYASAVILDAIAQRKSYGFQMIDATGLPSGTVYPALRRMEAAGLIEAGWDYEAAEKSGGPARKHYRLTRGGVQHLEVLRGRYIQLAAPAVKPK